MEREKLREEARKKAFLPVQRRYTGIPELRDVFNVGFSAGFDAGAASVDRAGIVRDVLDVIRRRYNVDLVDAEKDELLSQYKGEGK